MVFTGIRRALAKSLTPKSDMASQGRIMSYEEGAQKEIGHIAWNERKQDIDEMTLGMRVPKLDKDGKAIPNQFEEMEIGSSFVRRVLTKATMGAGQIGNKYPITNKNLVAFRDLGMWAESFTGLCKGEDKDALEFQELLFEAGFQFVDRSIYGKDTDISVARMQPVVNDWKSNKDSLTNI